MLTGKKFKVARERSKSALNVGRMP